MALLHREITDVQRSIDTMQSSTVDQQDLRRMEQRLQEMTDQNMRSNADLAVQVQELQERLEALHASLEQTTRKLEKISQELAASRVRQPAILPPVTTTQPDTEVDPADLGATTEGAPAATAGTAAALADAAVSPDQLYRAAYEDYMRGNYDLAAQGFQEYMRRFPATDLSDNALYWIGECYDAQELHEEALEVFSRVLEEHPNSDKAAAAQLKKGLIYLKTGDQGQGVVNLQYVVYEHPGTKEAELAREKLRSLGLNIR
jgi:tol-pal system protein YbgF